MIKTIIDFLAELCNHPAAVFVLAGGALGGAARYAAAKAGKRRAGETHKRHGVNAEYFRYISHAQYRGKE